MSVVTNYIDQLPSEEQAVLGNLRRLVYDIVPDAEDAFSYGVPTYRYKGRYMIAFASNKHFMSIYPGSNAIEEFQDELSKFKLSKGTISFTVQNPLPEDLFKKIVLSAQAAIDQRH